MVCIELCLLFVLVGGGLIYSVQLDVQVVMQFEFNIKIGLVLVKILYFVAVFNIGLIIDENFIVQGQVDDFFFKIGGIEWYIYKYIVLVVGMEVLIFQLVLF